MILPKGDSLKGPITKSPISCNKKGPLVRQTLWLHESPATRQEWYPLSQAQCWGLFMPQPRPSMCPYKIVSLFQHSVSAVNLSWSLLMLSHCGHISAELTVNKQAYRSHLLSELEITLLYCLVWCPISSSPPLISSWLARQWDWDPHLMLLYGCKQSDSWGKHSINLLLTDSMPHPPCMVTTKQL